MMCGGRHPRRRPYTRRSHIHPRLKDAPATTNTAAAAAAAAVTTIARVAVATGAAPQVATPPPIHSALLRSIPHTHDDPKCSSVGSSGGSCGSSSG